ncbi:hypothetical protein PR048_032459 [Dryococelus australis]|uniref:Uncharacterized protein n=1 Tax=Dryococelus australis TaxID=614101 RepID=A0ABQ9G2A2_9NEOP|nr:hypothetical protein PR048_032459 [Dryococelus australis]
MQGRRRRETPEKAPPDSGNSERSRLESNPDHFGRRRIADRYTVDGRVTPRIAAIPRIASANSAQASRESEKEASISEKVGLNVKCGEHNSSVNLRMSGAFKGDDIITRGRADAIRAGESVAAAKVFKNSRAGGGGCRCSYVDLDKIPRRVEVRGVWSSAEIRGRGDTRNPQENPPTSGIIRHDSLVRKSGGGGATSPGIEPGSPKWEASSPTPTAPRALRTVTMSLQKLYRSDSLIPCLPRTSRPPAHTELWIFQLQRRSSTLPQLSERVHTDRPPLRQNHARCVAVKAGGFSLTPR